MVKAKCRPLKTQTNVMKNLMLAFALFAVMDVTCQKRPNVKLSIVNKKKSIDLKDENGRVIGKQIVDDTVRVKTKNKKDSVITKTTLKIDTISTGYTSVDFSTENWLRDPLTVNFRSGQKVLHRYKIVVNDKKDTIFHRLSFFNGFLVRKSKKVCRHENRGNNYGLAGLRLIFEPQFGTIFQTNTNRLDKNSVAVMPKFGLETNIWGGWITLQSFIIFPVPSVSYDSQSPILKQSVLVGNTVNVDYGLGYGFSFLDGIFAIGLVTLHIDPRGFDTNSTAFKEGLLQNQYYYFSIQTISAVRKILKGQQNK
jgi:hypothetical protein